MVLAVRLASSADPGTSIMVFETELARIFRVIEWRNGLGKRLLVISERLA
jgi:hypothetical protein